MGVFITLHLYGGAYRPFYVRPSSISVIKGSESFSGAKIWVDGVDFDVKESPEEVRALITTNSWS